MHFAEPAPTDAHLLHIWHRVLWDSAPICLPSGEFLLHYRMSVCGGSTLLLKWAESSLSDCSWLILIIYSSKSSHFLHFHRRCTAGTLHPLVMQLPKNLSVTAKCSTAMNLTGNIGSSKEVEKRVERRRSEKWNESGTWRERELRSCCLVSKGDGGGKGRTQRVKLPFLSHRKKWKLVSLRGEGAFILVFL